MSHRPFRPLHRLALLLLCCAGLSIAAPAPVRAQDAGDPGGCSTGYSAATPPPSAPVRPLTGSPFRPYSPKAS